MPVTRTFVPDAEGPAVSVGCAVLERPGWGGRGPADSCDQVLGHLAKSAVLALRVPAQQVEGLVNSAALFGHEDPDGLVDEGS